MGSINLRLTCLLTLNRCVCVCVDASCFVSNYRTNVWSEVQIICIWFSCCHCHPVISWFIKIQFGLTFLVPVYSGKEAVKQAYVYVSDH